MNWVLGAMCAFCMEGGVLVQLLRRRRRRARSTALALYRPPAAALPPPLGQARDLDAELGRAVVHAVDRYHELNAG